MKEITEVKSEVMSTIEISELTGKDHGSIVMRDVRKMLKLLDIDDCKFAAMYKDKYNRDKPMYLLPKNLTLTLVSGYSVQMRFKIVSRWEELEKTVKELDIVSKVKAIALTGNFNEATKAVADLCKDSEQVGKIGSKLMTERKRQKREAKKLIEEVSSRFQLNLF